MVLVPVPVEVIPPGILFIVQFPVDGNPPKTTLPVDTDNVGWVIVPKAGAVGVAGCALISTFADAAETHPDELVTV